MAKEKSPSDDKSGEKDGEKNSGTGDNSPIPTEGTAPISHPNDTKGSMLSIKCCLWTSLTSSNPEAKLAYKAGPMKLLQTGTLENVRKTVQQMKTKAAKDIGGLLFCDKSGAVVEDSEHLEAYFSMNGQTVEDANKSAYFTVYFRAERDAIKPDASKEGLAAQQSASEKLREALKHVEPEKLKHLNIDELFKEADYQAKTGDLDKAADMTEKDWNVVMRNNALLCGYVVQAMSAPTETVNGKATEPVIRSIRRAPYPSFTLKPRTFASYEISNATEGKSQIHHIPHWQQDDFSYVSVTETDSAMKESLVKSGFSDWDVSASGSGSAFGFSVSASVSVSGSKSTATSTDTETTQKKLTVSYNFPRVRVMFDPESLELSPECKADLSRITDECTATDVYKFQHKYGAFFPTDVQLGGRLHSTTEKGSFKVAEGSDEMNTFKSAAAASFSSPTGAGGSAGAGYSQENQSHSQNAKAQSNVAIMWEATGGNTLLANSPPDWCPTVGSFYNWRVVKQEGVVPLIDHIGLIKDYADKAKIIRDILNKKEKADLKAQHDALLEEQKRLMEAKSMTFELTLTSSSRSIKNGSKWRMLFPQSATPQTRRSTMFFEVSGSGISWAGLKGYQSEVPSIKAERDYYLRHGTDVQFCENSPTSWPQSTSSFIAKTETGEVVEQLFLNTKYQIFDSTGRYRLQATQWTNSTMVYAFVTFMDKDHLQRQTYVVFQTPGGSKSEGRISPSQDVEMIVYSAQGSGHYPGLYSSSPSEWYNNAAISYDDMVKTRAWQTVTAYNFRVVTVPEPKKSTTT